jgi:hypothetical protein
MLIPQDIGYSVLLSDVDIVILQNPFDHLYRDSDVEGMTDGFDERTAYGAFSQSCSHPRDSDVEGMTDGFDTRTANGTGALLVFTLVRFTLWGHDGRV